MWLRLGLSWVRWMEDGEVMATDWVVPHSNSMMACIIYKPEETELHQVKDPVKGHHFPISGGAQNVQ